MNIKRLICRILVTLLICSGLIYPIATPANAASLVNLTDSLSNYTAGSTASHTIVFTLPAQSVGMVKDDKILVDFPVGFNISGAILGTVTVNGASNSYNLINNGQQAIVNKNGNNFVTPGSAISIQLNGIINPPTVANYHVTVTTTTTPADGPTDSAQFSIVSGGTSTTTSVDSSLNPSTYGQSVSFTATVTPASATGTVQFQIDGVDFGSPVTLSGGTATSSSTSTLTAGNHTISVAYNGDASYAPSTGTTSQTVSKATPAITWANPADITYPTALSTAQLNAACSIPGTFVYNPLAGTILEVGSNHPLNVTFTPTDSVNYNQATATVYINVLQASTTIALSNLNQTYDGTAKSATVTTTPLGLDYSITYNGYTTSPVNADSYSVVATITEPGYSGEATGTLVISPAPITVTADAETKVYGQPDPTLTYQITSGTLSGSDSFTGTLTRVPGENVGTYAIQQGSLSAGSNYNLIYIGANFIVSKASAVITLGDLNHTYDKTPKSASVTTSPPGLSNSITYNGSSTPPVNGSSYTVVATITDLNYTGTATDTLVISPAPISVTADANNKVYGQTNPALTYQITSGTLFGSDTMTGALTRVSGESVGTYAIQQGSLSAGSNYTLAFIGANLTITKANLTVRANNAARAYGEPNPTFTVGYSGFVNSDDELDLSGAPILSTTATSTSPVGNYVITITQGSLSSPNYTFTLINGTLVIGSNVITVTANPQTKVYGEPDPVLTYSALSNITFTGTLQRAVGENVGSYPINIGTLSAGSDYTINFIVANLTITKATPVITWSNPADIINPAPLSASQLNAVATVLGTFVYTPAAGTILNAGDNQVLHVDFTPTDISNYNTASKDVNITVLPAAPGGGGGLPDGGGSGGDSGSSGGGGGSSDRMYLANYMKDTPGVFSEDVSLKAWDGICNLAIPKNTTAKTVEGWSVSYITFEPVPVDKQTLPPPERGNIIGSTYSLGPEGTTFDPPITMSILYFPEKLPAGIKDSDLIIGYWNPGTQKWEPLNGCKVNNVNHTVTVPISHFSIYTVLGIPQPAQSAPPPTQSTPPQVPSAPKPEDNPPENNNRSNNQTIVTTTPAAPIEPTSSAVAKPPLSAAVFSLGVPIFSSSHASPGQKVDISVLVSNKGELSGNYILTFKINGDVAETRQLTLAGQSDQKVIFTFSQNQGGKYLVDINGLSGTIEIISSFLPGWLLPVCVGSAALVFGLTLLFVLRKSSRLGLRLT